MDAVIIPAAHTELLANAAARQTANAMDILMGSSSMMTVFWPGRMGSPPPLPVLAILVWPGSLTHCSLARLVTSRQALSLPCLAASALVCGARCEAL